jgi:DNA-binding response OmpR family regulator
MTGAEVAREAKLRRPGLPMLFITGYADLAAVQDLGEDAIVQKPFRNDELVRRVRGLLGTPRSRNVIPIRR